MAKKIITQKDVEYVAKLARVAISDDEKTRYQDQIEKILEYVSQLKNKATEGITPTAHPFEVGTVWREDESRTYENIDGVLQNAPEREETFFKVKKVIE